MMADPTHKRTPLFLLAVSPLVWALHFFATYLSAAIWCAKYPEGEFSSLILIISIFSIFAVIIIVREMIKGFQIHKKGKTPPPHDQASFEGQERFLNLARILVSCMSFIAVIYTAYAASIFRSCVR